MFAAIRNGLGKATVGLRARGVAGLFLFEFFVVVLGVLAAQGLQEWASRREEQRHVEQELERLSEGYARTRQLGTAWRAAIPCLRERIGQLMRAAATGAPVSSQLIQRPRLIIAGYPGTAVETQAGIVALLGPRKGEALLDVQTRAGHMDDSVQAMVARWGKFGLLDPAYGPVSASDRSIAREAGAEILMQMHSIEIAIANVEEQSSVLGLPDQAPRATGELLPVASCAQLWKDGTAYRVAR